MTPKTGGLSSSSDPELSLDIYLSQGLLAAPYFLDRNPLPPHVPFRPRAGITQLR